MPNISERLARLMRIAPPCLAALVLSGCSAPIWEDAAFGTLPVPDPRTDCQIRDTTMHADGSSPFVGGSVNSRITTIIGAANCPDGMPVSIPTRTTIPLRRAAPTLSE